MVNVSPETAKLAQEKGFDDLCSAFYFPSKILNKNLHPPRNNSEFSKNKSGYVCSAPTKEELKNWLREKYKIHVSIAPWQDLETKKTMYEGNVIEENFEFLTTQIDSFSEDYYECFEACLIFALKSINLKK